MASPSQDDSLVFADETKWSEKHWSEPDLPDTSKLFQSPPIPYEPTQLDRTSPLKHKTFSSAEDSFSVPLTRRNRDVIEETPIQEADTQLIPLHDIQASAQETQVLEDKRDIVEYSETKDTQVIGAGPNSSTDKEYADTLPIVHEEHDASGVQDTQVIRGSQVKYDDTQIIPGDTQNIPGDTQLIPGDTQLIPGGDTQLIQHDQSDAPEHADFRTASTIQGGPSMLFVTAQTDLSHKGDDVVASSPKKDSQSVVWGNTQPITQVVLPPEPDKQVQSSPANYEYVENTTFDLSPNDHLHEPTTQVVNTQEELLAVDVRAVDLGCKPVFSSSQNDETKRSVEYSIISNDDEVVTDDEHTMLYDDSIVQHKKRKMERLQFKEGVVSPPQNDKIVRLVSPYEPSEDNMMSASPKVEVDVPSSNLVPYKTHWSQSSSELEDISHDVSDFDIRDIPMATLEDGVDDDEVIAPKSRRANMAETQSQERSIRTEDLNVLSVDAILNPSAFWAFTQFKLFPARLLQAKDGSSYVQHCDLATLDTRNTDLFLLDLRIGDVVQVSLIIGDYVVTGLHVASKESLFTCLRGFDSVTLAKKGRHNVLRDREITVPLFQICMEIGQWAFHQLRFKLLSKETDLIQESYAVVKNFMPFHESRVDGMDAAIRAESFHKSPQKYESRSELDSNIFEGMFFFVTSIEGAKKEYLADIITKNGGLFVDDEIEHFVKRSVDVNGRLGLKLAKFKGNTFGALISDSHSRSAKYLQALALGWPILAETFVEQAIANASVLDNWQAFLLPAGFSLHTSGIVSHNVYEFRLNQKKGADMSEQLLNNSHLLAAYSVLVLDKKQDSKTLTMCGFIFHAFGAKQLHFVDGLTELDTFLKETPTDEVLVYDNSQREYYKLQTKKSRIKSSRKIAVIDWEWVVQCTISGYVWQPEYVND